MTIQANKCVYLGTFDLCKDKNDLLAIACIDNLMILGTAFTHAVISKSYYAKAKDKNILDGLIKACCSKEDTSFATKNKARRASKKAPASQRNWWVNFEEYITNNKDKYPLTVRNYVPFLTPISYEDAMAKLSKKRKKLNSAISPKMKRKSVLEKLEKNRTAMAEGYSGFNSAKKTSLENILEELQLPKKIKVDILNWYFIWSKDKKDDVSALSPTLNYYFTQFEQAQKDEEPDIVNNLVLVYTTPTKKDNELVHNLRKLYEVELSNGASAGSEQSGIMPDVEQTKPRHRRFSFSSIFSGLFKKKR